MLVNNETCPAYLALPIAELAFPLWLFIQRVNDQWREKRAPESASLAPVPTG